MCNVIISGEKRMTSTMNAWLVQKTETKSSNGCVPLIITCPANC